jgi:hypothetical protein
MRRFAAIHIFFMAIAFAIAPCIMTVSAAAPDASVKSTRGEPTLQHSSGGDMAEYFDANRTVTAHLLLTACT